MIRRPPGTATPAPTPDPQQLARAVRKVGVVYALGGNGSARKGGGGVNRDRYPNPQALRRAIRMGWLADTSADPDGWTPRRPSHGQCAVTALVVQDAFGGQLLRAVNEGISHYWNRLPDGTQHDLTRQQFDAWKPTRTQVRAREYVLSFPVTAERYRRLLDRIGVVW